MEQQIDADSKNVALSRKTSRNTNRIVIQVRYKGCIFIHVLEYISPVVVKACKITLTFLL